MKNIFRLLISFVFLGIFAYLIRDEFPQILETLKGVRQSVLWASIAFTTVGSLLLAWRLKLVFDVHHDNLPYWEALKLTFIGFFFNNFLPTSVGGDIVKAYCASRLTGEKLKAFTCVLMDRIFGLLAFVVVPSVTVVFMMKTFDPKIPMTIFGILVFALVCLFMMFNRGVMGRLKFIPAFLDRFPWGKKLHMIYDDIHFFREHPAVMAKVSIISLVWQIIGVLTVYGFVIAIGKDIHPMYLFLLLPIVHLMSMLPSINGLGIREHAFLYFFQSRLGSGGSASIAILYLLLLIVLSGIGGIVYVLSPQYHFRFRDIVGGKAE